MINFNGGLIMSLQQQPVRITPNKSQIALKAFFNLGEKWQLNDKQKMILLGEPSRATFYRWKDGKVKSFHKDTIERISYLLGIYKALHILFTDKEQANNWLHKPNQASLFAGRSALDYMLQGNMVNLFDVRHYLDYQRGH